MANRTSRHEMALDALADPTRRAILERLRLGASAVGPLAETLPISRPAVSQHLKVLCDAGLCQVQPEGTRRIYGLAPRGMEDVRAYIDDLWGDALTAFARAAHTRERRERDAP